MINRWHTARRSMARGETMKGIAKSLEISILVVAVVAPHLLVAPLTAYAQVTAQTNSREATGTRVHSGIRRAVIVGISGYKLLPKEKQLDYATRDAKLFLAFLRSRAGGGIDEKNLRVLLDTEATQANIWAELRWLTSQSQGGDEAIFYFAGHGDVEEKDGDQTGFLLGYDAAGGRAYVGGHGAIGILNVQDLVQRAAKRDVNFLIITDACRAGKLVGTEEGARLTTTALLAEWDKTVKIVSSQPNGLSREGYKWGGGHGVFTWFLVDGLLGKASDDNRDGAIDQAELQLYVGAAVSRETAGEQHPASSGNTNWRLSVPNPQSRVEVLRFDTCQACRYAATDDTNKVTLASSNTTRVAQAIRRGQLVRPLGSSAWDTYERMSWQGIPSSEREAITGKLAAAMQNDAQGVIATYMRSANAITPARYREAAQEVGIAAALLGPEDPTINSLEARRLFLEGYAALRRSEYKPAIDLLRRSREREPSAFALNGLGAAYVNAGKLDSAAPLLKEAAARAPTWSYPLNNLGVVYFTRGQFDSAAHAFEQAARIDTNYGKSYANLGQALWKLNRQAEAESKWQRGLEKDPESSAELIAKFDVQQRNDVAAAETVYTRALTMYPKSALLHVRLGDFFKGRRRFDDAEREYKRAISLDSSLAIGYSGLGTLEMERFDIDSFPFRLNHAADVFLRASALAPEDPAFPRNLGIALLVNSKADSTAADSLLHLAAALDTLDYESYKQLAWLQNARAQWTGLEESARRMIALKPESGEGYAALAIALHEQRRPGAAEAMEEAKARDREIGLATAKRLAKPPGAPR